MSQEAAGRFFKLIDEDETMRQKFASEVPQTIEGGAPIVAFAAKHGFQFTEEELKAAADAVGNRSASAQLSESDLKAVVGGLGTLGYAFPAGSPSSRVLGSLAKLRPGGSVMC